MSNTQFISIRAHEYLSMHIKNYKKKKILFHFAQQIIHSQNSAERNEPKIKKKTKYERNVTATKAVAATVVTEKQTSLMRFPKGWIPHFNLIISNMCIEYICLLTLVCAYTHSHTPTQ